MISDIYFWCVNTIRDLNSRQEFAARYILKEQKIECKFRMQGSEKLDRLVQAVLKRTGTFFQVLIFYYYYYFAYRSKKCIENKLENKKMVVCGKL